MTQVLIILFVIVIQFFPFVRQWLPQRDEDWLFYITSRQQNIVKLIHDTLNKFLPYYVNLSKKGQQRFMKRVLFLILKKTVVGYHDFKINHEVAIVIFAAQVQLTFGMRKFSMPFIKKILVYPDIFYSRYLEHNVEGLTSGLGYVNISWKHGVQGYSDPNDNKNLLLHEFAHALMIQLARQEDNDYRIQYNIQKYGSKAIEIFEKLKKDGNGSHSYLRDYGLNNKHEFFAVSVEHFFESPERFKNELPELFDLLCKMLNQNSLNSRLDYAIK
ncbi:MAG: zinc-dependent peptidase [Bacteroidia bacterium]